MILESGDLLAQGMVTNVARPGGNATGISVIAAPDHEGKVLSVLHEAAPAAKVFAYTQTGSDGQFRATARNVVESVTAAASRLGLMMVPLVYSGGGGEAEFADLFRRVMAAKVDMVLWGSEVGVTASVIQTLLANLALEARLPSIASETGYVRRGGLLGYGANYPFLARLCADYVALVLGGANPGDLPVQQPTVYDLGVNLKTARAIGVSIPPPILAQATLVIE
jgi:putative ABC transport system substrate-binding protein